MRVWRVPATGLCFVSFGLSGLLLGYVLLPLVHWLAPTREQATLRSRRYIQRACHLFITFMRGLGVLSREFYNPADLAGPGRLVVANHPSLIDVIFLLSHLPNSACIARYGLFHNPVTRGPLRRAGYIPNHNASQLLVDCQAALNAGTSLIVFPEGTRSTPGEALKFQRGAAHLYLRARPPLTLVSICVSPPTLFKSQPWYRVPDRRPHFALRATAQAPLPAVEGNSYARAARALTGSWQDYFTRETKL